MIVDRMLALMAVDAKLQAVRSQSSRNQGKRGRKCSNNDVPNPRKAVKMGMYTTRVLRPCTAQQRYTKVIVQVRLLNERRRRDAKIVAGVSTCTTLVPDKRCSNRTVNTDSNNKCGSKYSPDRIGTLSGKDERWKIGEETGWERRRRRGWTCVRARERACMRGPMQYILLQTMYVFSIDQCRRVACWTYHTERSRTSYQLQRQRVTNRYSSCC